VDVAPDAVTDCRRSNPSIPDTTRGKTNEKEAFFVVITVFKGSDNPNNLLALYMILGAYVKVLIRTFCNG
jgi:hypothetical protein